jgi:hypothetical protein
MERSNNRFAHEGGGAACETFARARHIRWQRRAPKRPNKQSLFPLRHSLRGADRLGGKGRPDCLGGSFLVRNRTGRPARHTSP